MLVRELYESLVILSGVERPAHALSMPVSTCADGVELSTLLRERGELGRWYAKIAGRPFPQPDMPDALVPTRTRANPSPFGFGEGKQLAANADRELVEEERSRDLNDVFAGRLVDAMRLYGEAVSEVRRRADRPRSAGVAHGLGARGRTGAARLRAARRSPHRPARSAAGGRADGAPRGRRVHHARGRRDARGHRDAAVPERGRGGGRVAAVEELARAARDALAARRAGQACSPGRRTPAARASAARHRRRRPRASRRASAPRGRGARARARSAAARRAAPASPASSTPSSTRCQPARSPPARTTRYASDGARLARR